MQPQGPGFNFQHHTPKRMVNRKLRGYYSTYIIFLFGDIALRADVMSEHTLTGATYPDLF